MCMNICVYMCIYVYICAYIYTPCTQWPTRGTAEIGYFTRSLVARIRKDPRVGNHQGPVGCV